MDQHEKDWLDLGRQLKDYSPQGNPTEDFQVLQELQQQERGRKKVSPLYWVSENLLLLVLLPLLGLIAFSVGKGEWDRYQRKTVTEKAIVAQVETTDLPLTSEDVEEPPMVSSSPAEVRSNSIPADDRVIRANTVKQSILNAATELPLVNPVTAEKQAAVIPAEKEENSPLLSDEIIPAVVALPTKTSKSVDVLVEALPSKEVELLATPVAFSTSPVKTISKRPATVQITLGTGLSNHWRGANFMQEVDRGIYAYVGLNRQLGNRLGLEGRIGYRGHGMRLPVFSDVESPWSYHKEEIHNTGHMGEDREYIYEGVVEGYQAIEL
ncbi:MAG: hypothetical protein AB8H12_16325, partial [Lewinella sp.]